MSRHRAISALLPRHATHWGRRLGLATLVGLVGGIAAVSIEWGIARGSALLVGRLADIGGGGIFRPDWRILLLPAAGGLLSSLWLRLVAPNTFGHGVDALTRAFHRGLGRLSLRGPFAKGAGCVLTISSGGSAGPEGPIAALGAALGSTIGGFFRVTPRERRILLLAGCAAGVGAIFSCPLGGALFATGIIYREPEFESDAIVSSFVASVVAYATFIGISGHHGPLIDGIAAYRFDAPIDLLWYAVLGPLCGLVAILFALTLRGVEHGVMSRLGRTRWIAPAFGGLATGLVACLFPQVMDGRFLFIQNAIDGSIFTGDWGRWSLLLALIVLAKCVATACTVGSGAPGGVLGPSVFVGGAVGALLGAIGMALAPEWMGEDLRRSLIPVGMAGILAATMRIPMAAMTMVVEMTGSWGLLPPLMIVCVTSYLVGRRFGVNSEQVRTAADSPAHALDPIVHLLEAWRVGDVLTRIWPLTVAPDAGMDAIVARLEPGTRPTVAVAEHDRLLGVITAHDLGTLFANPEAAALLVASDVMSRDLVAVEPDEDVYTALTRFRRGDHAVLPVIERDGRWAGMLERRAVVGALRERLEAANAAAVREHAGLGALESDVKMEQLLMGVPAAHANIQRLFVPIDALGVSLRACDFRNRYNAQVIGVEEPDGSLRCPPDLDAPLRSDQRLLTVVWRDEEPAPAEAE